LISEKVTNAYDL